MTKPSALLTSILASRNLPRDAMSIAVGVALDRLFPDGVPEDSDAAFDAMCSCGHARIWHVGPRGVGLGSGPACHCGCDCFEAKADPAPKPAASAPVVESAEGASYGCGLLDDMRLMAASILEDKTMLGTDEVRAAEALLLAEKNRELVGWVDALNQRDTALAQSKRLEAELAESQSVVDVNRATVRSMAREIAAITDERDTVDARLAAHAKAVERAKNERQHEPFSRALCTLIEELEKT